MDTQTELTVGQALQLFYKFGISALPVVNERSELIGTFDKSDAVSLGTLRSRLEEKLGPHLARLLQPAGPAIEGRLKRLLFEKSKTVPVLTRDGRLSHFWSVSAESVDEPHPMPYRELLLALIDQFRRPIALVFQEPSAGESASGFFLQRIGLVRGAVRQWMDQTRWQSSSAGASVATIQDPEDLPVWVIRTPLRLGDRHFGWILDAREDYEVSAELLCVPAGGPAEGRRRRAGGRSGIAQTIRKVVSGFEQYVLKKGLARSGGDPRRLVDLLGLSRQSLRYKMKKHRLAKKK